MKRREFIGNTVAIGGMASVVPISQLYSNVQKQLSYNDNKTNYDVIVIGVGSRVHPLVITSQSKGIAY